MIKTNVFCFYENENEFILDHIGYVEDDYIVSNHIYEGIGIYRFRIPEGFKEFCFFLNDGEGVGYICSTEKHFNEICKRINIALEDAAFKEKYCNPFPPIIFLKKRNEIL